MESPSCSRWESVANPAMISAEAKYVFEFVSRNKQECQGDNFLASSGGGVAIAAALQSTENASQGVPRKGYVFHGIGPNCSQGS